MGLKLAAIVSSALALAPVTPADYVASRQQADGGFAEPGARSDSALTAWSVLGLKAAEQDVRIWPLLGFAHRA